MSTAILVAGWIAVICVLWAMSHAARQMISEARDGPEFFGLMVAVAMSALVLGLAVNTLVS